MEEQDARNWLNISMTMLRKCKEQGEMRLSYLNMNLEKKGGIASKQPLSVEQIQSMTEMRETWDHLMTFMQLISRKMEDAH
jgi:hypothetical protein